MATSPASPSRVSLEDLTLTTIGDSDYFSFVPATGGTLQVTAIVEGVSLLSPQVSLYDASQALLDAEGSPAQYGQDVSASVAAVTAGQPYYIKVSGATDDVFSIGTYDLNISFEGGQAVGTTVRVPLPTRAPTPLAGTPPVAPPLSPSAPPAGGLEDRSAPGRPASSHGASRCPASRLARLRRPSANAEGQARASVQGRQGKGDRVAQDGRSLAASKIVARASRPNRFGRPSPRHSPDEAPRAPATREGSTVAGSRVPECLQNLRAPVDKPRLTRLAFRRTIPTDRTAGGPFLRSIDEMEVVS